MLFVLLIVVLEAARPQCWDLGHPCGGTIKMQNTTKSSRVCLVLLHVFTSVLTKQAFLLFKTL